MPTSVEEDLNLMMTCLKHTENRGKPDFTAVAPELGLKPSTCYNRHWNLLKKWGMTGSKAADAGSALNGNGTGSAPATPSAKRKSGSAGHKGGKSKKITIPTLDAEDDLDGTPPKRIKTDPGKEEKKPKIDHQAKHEQDTIEINDDDDDDDDDDNDDEEDGH